MVDNNLKHLIKLAYSTVILVVVTVVALNSYWFIDPAGFRFHIFQPVRDAAYLVRELDLFNDWDKVTKIQIPSAEFITLKPRNNSEINIVADLYQKPDGSNKPVMIALHGSQPWGRKQGLIRFLGHHYAENGWVVLAPDARGFGDTDNPANFNDPDSWNVETDIQRIIDYTLSLPNIDPDQIYLFGHSLGANYALEGGLQDKRVRSLILVGPSRHLETSEDEKYSLWKRTRFSVDRMLDEPISVEVMKQRIPRSDISLLAKDHLSGKHKPILLIDGENEGSDNIQFLKKVVKEMSQPYVYVTLRDTGHYCGVVNMFGSGAVYYSPDKINQLIAAITDFVARSVFREKPE